MVGRKLKHYEIEAVLGKGGMGTVYRARDSRLHRPVALKVLAADLTADPDRRQRFFQEARAAAAITHPAIAQVYDVDEADGVTFIAMELVEGETLRRLIAAKDLDLFSVLEIAIQVSEGLERAHRTGVVHRDIKSENIMLTGDGYAKILDFGLAKLNPLHNLQADFGAEEHMSQLATIAQTREGVIVGTLAYMSPEQARGRTLDHRSDIFSLGVTIYEMATGHLPFTGESPLDTMHAIAFEETRPITMLRRDLPPELHRIVARCLRKRPEDRYPEAAALAEDLKALKKDMDSGVTRALPLLERFRDSYDALRNLKPSSMYWIAGGAGALLLAMFVLFFVFRPGDLWPTLLFVVFCLFLYRHFRHRTQRLMKRFAARAGKIPEVRLITCQQKRVIVVIDRMAAKVFLRINSLIEAVNKKLFFGDPLEVVLRDDVSAEEFRRLLQEPGVLYLRDDAFEPSR